GQYLLERGVQKHEFNSYGSRRGNDRVMTRGTFANIRLKNQVAPGTEGGCTTDFTDGQVKSIYEASRNSLAQGGPTIVIAGQDYGTGSSRDWAAKGPNLHGVQAGNARCSPRNHRSYAVGIGGMPHQFVDGQDADVHGLTGTETYDIDVSEPIAPRQRVTVTATREDGSTVAFEAVLRLDTPVEIDYFRNGGILHT